MATSALLLYPQHPDSATGSPPFISSPSYDPTARLDDSQSQSHGLGIFNYPSLLRRPSSPGGSVNGTSRSASPPEPTPEMWTSCASVPKQAGQAEATSSSQAPDIFSAAYDPFASYHSAGQSSQAFLGSTINFTSTPSNVPELSSSPSSSCNMSTRSSFSFAPMEGVTCRGVGSSGAQEKVKSEWLAMQPGPEHHQQSQQQQSLPMFAGHGQIQIASMGQSSSLTAQNPFEDGGSFLADTRNYAVPAYAGGFARSPSQSSTVRYSQPQPQPQQQQPQQQQRTSPAVQTDVARTRKRRQLTTAAEANHECHVCGKLFGRSYNYKAHMETHDPTREYPHPCLVPACAKKFVRKTDLMRHHQSVHMKQRNYQCELCGNMFARKDTLRRHTEDGCAKRFEITSKTPRRASSLSHSSGDRSGSRAGVGSSSAGGFDHLAPHQQQGGSLVSLKPSSSPMMRRASHQPLHSADFPLQQQQQQQHYPRPAQQPTEQLQIHSPLPTGRASPYARSVSSGGYISPGPVGSGYW